MCGGTGSGAEGGQASPDGAAGAEPAEQARVGGQTYRSTSVTDANELGIRVGGRQRKREQGEESKEW